MHGGVAKDNLKEENVNAVKAGIVNLERHVNNIKNSVLNRLLQLMRLSMIQMQKLNM